MRYSQGDLFRSGAPCLINTVNCVGAMGKGEALEFKQRYLICFRTTSVTVVPASCAPE